MPERERSGWLGHQQASRALVANVGLGWKEEVCGLVANDKRASIGDLPFVGDRPAAAPALSAKLVESRGVGGKAPKRNKREGAGWIGDVNRDGVTASPARADRCDQPATYLAVLVKPTGYRLITVV